MSGRRIRDIVVLDRVRPVDPTDDREDVIGATSDPKRAVELAKSAKGEGVIIVEERDGTKREFSRRMYNAADLEFAQKTCERRGDPQPKSLDPYVGFTEFYAKTRGRRKSAKRS